MQKVVLALLLAASKLAFADAAARAAPDCAASQQLATDLRAAPRSIQPLRQLAARTERLLQDASDDACHESIVDVFYRYYQDVRDAMCDTVKSLDETRRAKLGLRTVGWVISDGEDGSYVHEGSAWLVHALSPALPAAWREYLKLKIDIQNKMVLDFDEFRDFDMTWRELRLHVRRWERFIARNPTFKYAAAARSKNAYDFRVFVTADGRRSPFDADQKLKTEVLVELEAYAADQNAARRELVRDYLHILKMHHFRQSDDSIAYLEKHLPEVHMPLDE